MNTSERTSTAWKHFFNEGVQYVIRDIRRRLPAAYADEAEDITYRSVEEVAQLEKGIQEPVKLRNTVLQRARWRLTDFMRKLQTQAESQKAWRERESARARALEARDMLLEETLKKDFWNLWETAMEKLDQRDRELVTGRCLYGESRDSLAERHDMHPATVGTRVCRSLKKVRALLEANNVGADFFGS